MTTLEACAGVAGVRALTATSDRERASLLPDGGCVLDLGSGSGRLLAHLQGGRERRVGALQAYFAPRRDGRRSVHAERWSAAALPRASATFFRRQCAGTGEIPLHVRRLTPIAPAHDHSRRWSESGSASGGDGAVTGYAKGLGPRQRAGEPEA